MKMKFRQKLITNLATAVMFVTAITFAWGSNGCFLYFYEPKKPENADKVTRQDLMKLVQR